MGGRDHASAKYICEHSFHSCQRSCAGSSEQSFSTDGENFPRAAAEYQFKAAEFQFIVDNAVIDV